MNNNVFGELSADIVVTETQIAVPNCGTPTIRLIFPPLKQSDIYELPKPVKSKFLESPKCTVDSNRHPTTINRYLRHEIAVEKFSNRRFVVR